LNDLFTYVDIDPNPAGIFEFNTPAIISLFSQFGVSLVHAYAAAIPDAPHAHLSLQS
jgi:hypothetical protein